MNLDLRRCHLATTPAPIAATLPMAVRARGIATPHLDRDRLRDGIAARHQALADLEARLAAACEIQAMRGRARTVRIDDRATWDRATWNRYLAAASRLEPEYGRRMRKLWQEIDHLKRLTELPIPA